MLLRLLPRAPTLPTQCAICRGWEAKRVCAECRVRYAPPTPRCRRCALRVPDGVVVCGACLTAPPPYDTVLAALDYAHPWDRLIGQLKFHAALDLATPLAQMLLRTWQAAGTPAPDWLLPVPLSAERLRERGYNQAWELARLVARGLGCRADAHLLLRIRDTPHQLAFPVEARAANVQAAFAVEPTRRAELRGRRITVIDDVMTTGATAAEIARVLRQAGAAAVDIAVVARTPAPADE